jgi:tRNA pseudouridine55 synthase
MATGVLPVAIGPATRLIEYMDDAPKTYLARVRFGVTTDTYDGEGDVTSSADASHLTAADVESALPAFVGEIEQMPPLYSAIKVAGKPLYRYAREGTKMELAPRRVRIDSIHLRGFGSGGQQTVDAELEISCGKGTYIRSLAHDLGQLLGCGAHVSALRRTRSGGFGIEEAHSPEALRSAAAIGALEELLLAPDRAVERRLAAIFDEVHVRDVICGREIGLPGGRGQDVCRAYDITGRFLGLLRASETGSWHPEKVLAGA